jgi:membrane protease YdiL (CAAX protease family)
MSTADTTLRRVALWRWLGIALSPFLLTLVVVTILYSTVGPSPVPRTPTGVYTLSNVVVVGLVVRWLSSRDRAAVLPLRTPTLYELVAATVVATAVGDGSETIGTVESVLGAVVFGVSSVAVAPIVEEVLFRGVAFSAVRVRYGVVAAVVGSTVLFGALHLAIGGVSGVVSTSLSGLLYAGLRVRYENLTGAIGAHCLNNAYWVAVTIGVAPHLVPS